MRKVIMAFISCFVILSLIACTDTSVSKNQEVSVTPVIPTSTPDRSEPGMYEIYRHIPWETLEKKRMLWIEDGKLQTYVNYDTALSEGIRGTIVLPKEYVDTIGREAFKFSRLREFTIPDTVKHIEEDAFSGCTQWKNIVIPEGVVSIGAYAFEDCRGVEAIYIPDSVKKIGHAAFHNVKHIYYNGSAKWEKNDLIWGARALN